MTLATLNSPAPLPAINSYKKKKVIGTNLTKYMHGLYARKKEKKKSEEENLKRSK